MNVINEDIEELKEIIQFSKDENILDGNKEMVSFLRKKGVKLREYKWTELIAS